MSPIQQPSSNQQKQTTKLMVLAKENIAAHAVAEHLVSPQMPDYLQKKMGRLVGYYEQNRKGSYTPLDILPSNRNQVIRQKSLLIGCGGGFQQECRQQFSRVTDWMGSVDLFLEDEGQQYGNMEEPLLREPQLHAWRYGPVTTHKLQVD